MKDLGHRVLAQPHKQTVAVYLQYKHDMSVFRKKQKTPGDLRWYTELLLTKIITYDSDLPSGSLIYWSYFLQRLKFILTKKKRKQKKDKKEPAESG